MVESRVVIGNFHTGRNILDLTTISDRWSVRRNAPHTLQCDVDLGDPGMRALQLRTTAGDGNAFMAKLLGDNVMAYGRINRALRTSARVLRLFAEFDYFQKRMVLPIDAMTEPLVDPVSGEPNPDTNTVLSGWDEGTILKKVIEQSMAWPGGDLPFVLEDDRVGTHEDEILGTSLTSIQQMLDNYTDRMDGPDWDIWPRLTTNRLGIELLFRTGTEAQPRLRSETTHDFDYSVPEPGIDELEMEFDNTDLTALSWTTGGRETGEALVAMAYDPTLIDADFPLFESVDNDHNSASDPVTLQAYSDERVRTGRRGKEFWPFRVRTDQAPFPGEYRVGDLCNVYVKDDDLIADGTYLREITSLGGDEDPNWVNVTTADPEY